MDFFFGELNKNETGQIEISLRDFMRLGQRVNNRYFVRQVNRLLRNNGGYLVLVDGTSHPPFVEFLEFFGKDDIGFSVISARTDVNNSVEATLDCSLFLDEGVIKVVPHWCAYKEIRAREVKDTLLVPLLNHGESGKIFIREGQHELSLLSIHEDEALRQLFYLSGYPNMKI